MSGVVLAGGGLANGLIAWRLRELRRDVPVILVEQGERLGGNHTWSFHQHDVTAEQLDWLRPFISHRWAAQDVLFPGHRRRLRMDYHSISSQRFHEVLAGVLGPGLRLGSRIADVQAGEVRLACGEIIAGDLVVDGRGASGLPGCELRWQKFLGQEIDTAGPHDLREPLLMDATVEQVDGYRFLYVLPLGARRLLVEDTYYSDDPALDLPVLRDRIAAYLQERGWRLQHLHREETGVLPIVLDGDPRGPWRDAGTGPARAGMRAGLFHHTTGYSLPDAVRLADALAAAPLLATRPVAAMVHGLAVRRWREQRFFRLLNRLMFEAASPATRYRTLEHFYRLPEPLIGRFYAGRPTAGDQLRVLSGRPPVPIGRALACIARSAWRRQGARLAGEGSA